MRSYLKLVHNKPFPANLPSDQLEIQRKLKNQNLAIFGFMGVAPLMLICLRGTALGFKDMASIGITPNNTNNSLVTNNLNNSSLFFNYFAYFLCSLAIFYQILIIILLRKFINKNIAIFSVLPDFIIN